MAKSELKIENIIPAQRANSRFKTTVEDFYATKKERFNVIISADRQSIKIYGLDYQGRPFENTFSVKDFAEYDSYNLSYYGEILKISEKSVTIEEKYSTRKHRLDLYTFCSRNWDWNVEEASEKNSDTMNYI